MLCTLSVLHMYLLALSAYLVELLVLLRELWTSGSTGTVNWLLSQTVLAGSNAKVSHAPTGTRIDAGPSTWSVWTSDRKGRDEAQA
jgi:hypothetical protein